ncbi:MAG: hypothetical protein KDA25_09970 [Phycisphaerales bacterium]|nr:hypothetical protein [Phycisphaerales bacterium]
MPTHTPNDHRTDRTLSPSDGAALEQRITDVGHRLSVSIDILLEAIPGGPRGPMELARTLGIDKVLASRLLKAARARDPLAVAHLAPGPEPLRRVIRAASRLGVDADTIARAGDAVDRFESLIRHDAGDRGGLDAMISAWLPEARDEFELRRKQSAFKAMSHIRGVYADLTLGTVLLHPSAGGERLDIVWLFGMLGLQRMRPGATVKLASRRMDHDESPRRPTTLEGEPIETPEHLRLDAFCSSPLAPLEIHRIGDVVLYTLGGDAFGPRSGVDLVFAEVNRNEIERYVPAGSGRRGHVFAEISTPAKALLFDALLHEDVYAGQSPDLFLYDTAFDGVASVNDRSRDIDRLDLAESVQDLGRGLPAFRTSVVPRYVEMLQLVFDRMGWDDAAFRGHRCRIDYPVYGSQVTMAFTPPSAPGT